MKIRSSFSTLLRPTSEWPAEINREVTAIFSRSGVERPKPATGPLPSVQSETGCEGKKASWSSRLLRLKFDHQHIRQRDLRSRRKRDLDVAIDTITLFASLDA